MLFDKFIGRKRNVGGFALAGLGGAVTHVWGREMQRRSRFFKPSETMGLVVMIGSVVDVFGTRRGSVPRGIGSEKDSD